MRALMKPAYATYSEVCDDCHILGHLRERLLAPVRNLCGRPSLIPQQVTEFVFHPYFYTLAWELRKDDCIP